VNALRSPPSHGELCYNASSADMLDADCDDCAPPARKVVIVAWGMSAQVAMYLAAPERLGSDHVAGVALFGSPALPTYPISWLRRVRFRSFRVAWIAEIARLAEYTSLDQETKRQLVSLHALRPEARADAEESFESRRAALVSACAAFTGPVMFMSGSRLYLSRVKALWGRALAEPGSNVECVFMRGLKPAGFRSFSLHHSHELSRHLVQFSSAAFV